MTATTIARPGRNEPCHCGSGRKYKQCCLEKDNAEASAARKAAAESVEQSSVVSETSDAATVKTVRSPKPRSHQPWKAAANTRGFGNRTRTPRKAGGARKAGSHKRTTMAQLEVAQGKVIEDLTPASPPAVV